MNLKESFQYQNHLTAMYNTVLSYLNNKENLVVVTQEHLRSIANPDAKDETLDATKERAFSQNVDAILAFVSAIVAEKYALTIAINRAKFACSMDIDAETTRNSMLRNLYSVLENICKIKSSERKIQGADFKFNINGEQMKYYYDVKETTTEDFDRANVKAMAKDMRKTADNVSSMLDHCMVETEVSFQPAFDISDSVEDALNAFSAQIYKGEKSI